MQDAEGASGAQIPGEAGQPERRDLSSLSQGGATKSALRVGKRQGPKAPSNVAGLRLRPSSLSFAQGTKEAAPSGGAPDPSLPKNLSLIRPEHSLAASGAGVATQKTVRYDLSDSSSSDEENFSYAGAKHRGRSKDSDGAGEGMDHDNQRSKDSDGAGEARKLRLPAHMMGGGGGEADVVAVRMQRRNMILKSVATVVLIASCFTTALVLPDALDELPPCEVAAVHDNQRGFASFTESEILGLEHITVHTFGGGDITVLPSDGGGGSGITVEWTASAATQTAVEQISVSAVLEGSAGRQLAVQAEWTGDVATALHNCPRADITVKLPRGVVNVGRPTIGLAINMLRPETWTGSVQPPAHEDEFPTGELRMHLLDGSTQAILGHNFGSVVLVNAVGGIEVMGVQFAKILYARAGLHGSAVIRHVRGGHELTVSSMGLPGAVVIEGAEMSVTSALESGHSAAKLRAESAAGDVTVSDVRVTMPADELLASGRGCPTGGVGSLDGFAAFVVELISSGAGGATLTLGVPSWPWPSAWSLPSPAAGGGWMAGNFVVSAPFGAAKLLPVSEAQRATLVQDDMAYAAELVRCSPSSTVERWSSAIAIRIIADGGGDAALHIS